jgi:hypothetical protein
MVGAAKRRVGMRREQWTVVAARSVWADRHDDADTNGPGDGQSASNVVTLRGAAFLSRSGNNSPLPIV